MSTNKNSDIFRVVARDPAFADAAQAATIILDHYKVDVESEVQKEMARQLIYGKEPSEGIPDVRPRFLRFGERT